MSEIPLLELDESPLEESVLPSDTHLASRFAELKSNQDEFGRQLTPYQKEKAVGIRRENGALNLKRLTARHLRIITMHLNGWSGGAIAHQMNLTQSRVSLILSDPLSRKILSQSHDDSKGEIRALVKHAVGAVREGLMGDNSLTTKFKAIDKLKHLQEMTGGEEKPATAEDLVQNLLNSGATFNIQVNNGVEQNANERSIKDINSG